jgi:hypothetical protein
MVNREKGDAIMHKMPIPRWMTVFMFGLMGVRIFGLLQFYRLVLLCRHVNGE